jgi:hypothetical protein
MTQSKYCFQSSYKAAQMTNLLTIPGVIS